MGADLFRPKRETEHGPLVPLVVGALFSLASVLRVVDALYLLRRPALLRVYLRTWRKAFEHTPWTDGSFDQLHDARRRHKSRIELTYGETPVVSAVQVLRAAGVGPGSRVLDLGCGRGRVLLAARYLGAEAVGVELVESHVALTRPLLAAIGADVRAGDAEEPPLEGVTHVFAAWTCFSAGTRARIERALEKAPAGLRVIALNHPVVSKNFALVRKITLTCSWGRVPTTIHERIGTVPDGGAEPPAV